MKTAAAAALVAALVAAAAALPAPDNSPQYGQQPQYEEPAKYSYSWSVQDDYTNNNYGQQEERNGDSTSGSYYVALPDGRLQKVTYTVNGDGGYVAEVTYEGEAQYPAATQYKANTI